MVSLVHYDIRDIRRIQAHAYRRENWRTPGDGHNPSDDPHHRMMMGPISVVFSIMILEGAPYRMISFRAPTPGMVPNFTYCLVLAQDFGFRGDYRTWHPVEDANFPEVKGFAQPIAKKRKEG